MRGALDLNRRLVHNVGIIPAYAGSTSIAYSSAATLRDHPRICGEHGDVRTLGGIE